MLRRKLLLGLGTAALFASASSILAEGSRLSISPQSGLVISGEAGTIYAIQSTTQLGDAASWRCETLVRLDNGSTTMPVSFLSSGGVRFFRACAFTASNMVFIPSGSFTMGSAASEPDRFGDEGPQTSVTISGGFLMGIYPVTQGLYESVTGLNPSSFTGDPELPVEQVSWFDATNFCYLLTLRERVAGRLPVGCAYRLPTEAEWEYACRAGTTTRFYYGDDLSYAALPDHAWYSDNSEGTRSVGQKPPNPWGLYDMAGNVWEWCLDRYGPGYPGGSAVDPAGPASGNNRVLRGGSWLDDARFCRSACRIGDDPAAGFYSNYGFRIVLALER
jgi:formylglycine-generating enzyme required for sulfatase activity